MKKTHLQQFLKSHNKLHDSFNYSLAHYRYYLYYHNSLHFLLRTHIRQQITFRIAIMNQRCYNNGSCIHCGCQTTQLQMSNHTCEGKEYPPLLSAPSWNLFKKGLTKITHRRSGTVWSIDLKSPIPRLIIKSPNIPITETNFSMDLITT
jgi:hypothetical protein